MNYPDELATQGQPTSCTNVLSKTQRQQFWADTCREITQMQISSTEVINLYRKFGCRFCTPTLEQAAHVITALDAAIPDWETTHPELFYQTLELNFPELVRRS